MKNLVSKLKPLIQLLLYAVLVVTIYVTAAALIDSATLPIPFKNSPEKVSKLLAVVTTILTALLTWITFRVNIEMFSGPEVAALGYVETFCNIVVEKFNLKPCYIFIPHELAQLNRENDYIAAIQTKGLTCTFDPQKRVYTIINPANNKKAYLDFPSTLRNLAKAVSRDGKLKKTDKLEKDLVRSFKKHVEKRLGITYKSKGFWRRLVELFRAKKSSEERTDLVQFYLTDPTIIATEVLAGFKQVE